MKQRTKDLIHTAATACLGVAALACALPARAQIADTNSTARFQPSAVLMPSDLKPESALQPESGRGLPQSRTLAPASERRSSTWERFGRQQPSAVVSDKTNVTLSRAKEEAKAGALGPAAVLMPSDLKPASALQPESGRGLPQSTTLAPVSEQRSSTWERFGRQQPVVAVSDKTNLTISRAKKDATAQAGASGPAAVLVPSDLKPASTLQPESGRGLPQSKTLAPVREEPSLTWERFGRQQPFVAAPPPLNPQVHGQPRPPAADAGRSRDPAVSGASFQARAMRASNPTGELGSSPHLVVQGKGSSQPVRPRLAAANTNITTLASLLEITSPLPKIVPPSMSGSTSAPAWLPPPFVQAPVVSKTARLRAPPGPVTLPSLPKELPSPSAVHGSNAAPARLSSAVAPAPVVSTTNRSEKTAPSQSTVGPARSGREPSAKTLGARTAESAPPPVAGKAVRAPVREKKPSQPGRSGPAGGATNTTARTGLPKSLPLPSPSVSTSMLDLNAAPIWLPSSLVPAPDATEPARTATATNTAVRPTPSQATTPPTPSAPVSATPQLPADLKSLMDQARELYSRQQFEEAAAKYREILKLDPENISGLSNLAVIRFQQGRLEDAEHLLNRAIQIAPDDAYSHATVGIIYFKQDRIDDAIEELTHALKLNPNNVEAHNYLGIACWKKGWRSAAEQELRRAIEMRPDYADAHYNLAVIYATQKPPFLGLAKFHYRKTLDLGRPRDPNLEKTLTGETSEK